MEVSDALTNTLTLNAETEVYQWTRFLACLDDIEEISRHLVKVGLSNGRYDDAFVIAGLNIWHDRVALVVAPSAMVDAFEWELAE